MSTVLIASVGGSPAPIASAIAARRPAHVLFLATRTEDDRPGSEQSVPAILERAQAAALPHEILVVPPDDPEAIFLALNEALRRLSRDRPKARLVFDYTGGTKSMTAALFQAAVATAGAELQFMAGRRDTLDRVSDGTERPAAIPIDWLLAERTETRLRAAWQRYAYAECAQGLRALLDDLRTDEKAPPGAIARLDDLANAADAFDAWDRFDHGGATETLAGLAIRHPSLRPHAERAARLSREEGARLPDLMRNAERAAARGRHDDAVARLYRLIEWTVQWQLAHRHGIDAGALDWDHPALTDAVVQQARLASLRDAQRANPRGKRTLSGLMQGIDLACALAPEATLARALAAPFPGKEKGKTVHGRLRDMLELRNGSILAHGATPLDAGKWEKFAAFIEVWNRTVLHPLLREAAIPHDQPQLPDAPPAGL